MNAEAVEGGWARFSGVEPDRIAGEKRRACEEPRTAGKIRDDRFGKAATEEVSAGGH